MRRRWLAVGAIGVAALYGGATISLAARAHLWNDELYTWYFAQLPSMRDVWSQLETGVEQIPPLFYVITRVSLAVLGDNDLALRAPALVGIALACACLFVVVRRRTSAGLGLVAALVPLATGAFQYAWEARPYALMVGFAAAAILSQQLRSDGVYPRLALAGLALTLAAATAVHYYAILAVLPLAAGEAMRAMQRRIIDWPAVAALASPLVPLAAFTPLIDGARRYANAFWTGYDVYSAPEFYVFLLRAGVFQPSRLPAWLALAFTAIVLGGALAILVRRPVVAPVDVTVATGFALLPFAGVGVAAVATGAYVDRYVLPAVLGPAMLLPLALDRVERGRRVVPGVAAVLVAAWFIVISQYWHREVTFDLDRQRALVAFVERETTPDGPPVAVAHPHDFLELAHHAPPRVAARLIRVSQPHAALRLLGSRSTEDGLVVLSEFAPLRVVPYRELDEPFVLLLTVRGREADWNWTRPLLEAEGRRIELVAQDRGAGFSLLRVGARRR